jgi:hypothetical protein
MAKKARIGDVCEIKTATGLAYVQYTHPHPSMGQLVRVLPGLYVSRADVRELAQQKELYFIFYVLDYALRDGKAKIVSNEPVPDWARPYPMMRYSRDFTDPPSWLIAAASTELTLDEIPKMLRVTRLTPEQKKLSISMLCAHPALVKKLEQGWTPERDAEMAAEAQAKRLAMPQSTRSQKEQFLDHYLYFPKKSNAEKAATHLRERGWTVEVKMGADGENWLALAKQPAPIEEDIGGIRDELEELADRLGGEYDGWGAAV